MSRAHRVSLTLILILLFAAPSAAIAKRQRGGTTLNRFAVPFICGENAESTDRVALGTYSATINLLNLTTSDAELRARILLAYPPESPGPGYVSMTRALQIGPGQALQIDCGEIDRVEFPDPPPDTPYRFGFLQLQTKGSLRVWVTQSAGTADGIALQTQQIEPEEIRVDSRRGEPEEIVICHIPPGNPGNLHEIVIDEAALPAHEAHGDYVGYCRDDD